MLKLGQLPIFESPILPIPTVQKFAFLVYYAHKQRVKLESLERAIFIFASQFLIRGGSELPPLKPSSITQPSWLHLDYGIVNAMIWAFRNGPRSRRRTLTMTSFPLLRSRVSLLKSSSETTAR